MYVNARHWHHEDRTCIFDLARWILSVSQRAARDSIEDSCTINLTSNSVSFCQSRHRATSLGITSPCDILRSAVVVGNSIDTEISHFQLNLAESNFTGPMCISGLMHSIPGGPSDELYLHGIILALPPPNTSPATCSLVPPLQSCL